MATDHWWLGTTSTDPEVAANWSTAGSGGAPGVSVPGTGDEVEFDGNGNNPCTLTAHWALLNMVVVVGYTAKLNLATFNLTMDSGGSVTLDGGGEFDAGSGSHSITAGTLDNKDQTTFTYSTSKWTLNGACSILGSSTNDFYDLTFASGSTVTVSARVEARGTVEINGAVVMDDILGVAFAGQIVINSGASFSNYSAARYLFLTSLSAGAGITTLHASVSMPYTIITHGHVDKVVVPGTWAGLLKINAFSSDTVWKPSSGTYNLDAGLELEVAGAGNVLVDNSMNGADFNCLNLIIDINSSGNATISNSAQVSDWSFTAHVIDQRGGGGAFTWTKGLGTIAISGSPNQDIDFMEQTIEDIVIDKVSGNTTLLGDFTTDSFTGTSTGTGSFDPNGRTITITGNCSWAAAFDFNSGATTMNGCSWDVGGDFTADGQTLNATASWVLTVGGTATASGTGSVEYSDASGGRTVMAYAGPWTDGGNNSNWRFTQFINNMQIGGDIGFDGQYLAVLPAGNVKIAL